MIKKLVVSLISVVASAIIVVGIVLFVQYREQKKLDDIYTQALVYYDQGNYEKAINELEKLLAIKENDTVRKRLNAIREEQQKVTVIKDLFQGIKKINQSIDNQSNYLSIKFLLSSIDASAQRFEALDTQEPNEINSFVEDFRQRPTYVLFRDEYITGNSIQSSNKRFVLDSEKGIIRDLTDDFLKLELPGHITLE